MFVPPFIVNHLGKIALTATATTLGALGFTHRERLRSFFSDEDYSEPQAQQRRRAETEVPGTVQSLLDKKHSELLDKLKSLNADAMNEFKGLLDGVHEELGSMTENFKELREEVASLKARQDAVEALVRGKSGEERVSNGKEAPASPSPRQMTGSTAASGSKRRGNGPVGPDSRPA